MAVDLTRPPAEPVALADVALRLDPRDALAIAKQPLAAGTLVTLDDGATLRIRRLVPPGHKFALAGVAEGEALLRYGHVIGFATQAIEPGDHIHSHNLAVRDFERAHDFCADYAPVEFVPDADRRTFSGYRRADGRVGTRNYVAILSSVNCSSSAAVTAARAVEESGILADYPHVDGVIALPHKGGCGAHIGSASVQQLQRTLMNTVRHPNVAGYVILSLGCEVNQPDDMVAHAGGGEAPTVITIQEDGGYAATVAAAVAAIGALLPIANEARREPVPISELVVALQCGGSDSWSGVTANPGLGKACDELVRQGGTVVLGETTEIYGAEHLLTRRARSPEVAERLLDRIRWWEDYTSYWGASIDNNPTPGNKAGGLTTIYEKSLGAAAKAGSTPLNEVADYGARVTQRGFVHMDTPGFDPVGVTGQVAGGCTIVVFTTGRGSAFGYKPAPSIKIGTNRELFERQAVDIDIDASVVLDGVSLDDLGARILDEIITVASGQPTKSEAAGIGAEEFNPWILGATL